MAFRLRKIPHRVYDQVRDQRVVQRLFYNVERIDNQPLTGKTMLYFRNKPELLDGY